MSLVLLEWNIDGSGLHGGYREVVVRIADLPRWIRRVAVLSSPPIWRGVAYAGYMPWAAAKAVVEALRGAGVPILSYAGDAGRALGASAAEEPYAPRPGDLALVLGDGGVYYIYFA